MLVSILVTMLKVCFFINYVLLIVIQSLFMHANVTVVVIQGRSFLKLLLLLNVYLFSIY